IKIPAIRSFKARHLDFSVRIEFLSDTPTDGVQLHSIEIAVSHGVREHTEKVTDTHCRFQNISCFKSHLSDRIIDGTNDGRTGIVGIQGTSSCCGIFFRRQGCIKFSEFLSQLALFSSKASASPPQPTYWERISCSSGVAFRPSNSNSFRTRIASILALNFAFAPPSP